MKSITWNINNQFSPLKKKPNMRFFGETHWLTKVPIEYSQPLCSFLLKCWKKTDKVNLLHIKIVLDY